VPRLGRSLRKASGFPLSFYCLRLCLGGVAAGSLKESRKGKAFPQRERPSRAGDASGALPADDAFPKAKAAALKALQIDETLAEPHVSLAHVK